MPAGPAERGFRSPLFLDKDEEGGGGGGGAGALMVMDEEKEAEEWFFPSSAWAFFSALSFRRKGMIWGSPIWGIFPGKGQWGAPWGVAVSGGASG